MLRRYRSSCSTLLSRIRNQRRRDARETQIIHMKRYFCNSFFCFLGLLIFQCPTRIYNAWNGPFSMTMKEFGSYLESNYDLFGLSSLLSFHWLLLFQPEYIQIELGENAINQNIRNSHRIFYGHHSYGQLLYTFDQILDPTIDTSPMTVYVKFSANEQSYSQKRHSYRFQSFSIATLRCIARQLLISPTEYQSWLEKSTYIETIERMYDENPMIFNRRVIRKCGILIGYLYQPTREYFYPAYSYDYHQFDPSVRVFDASRSYTPYMSYALAALFLYLLSNIVIRLVRLVIQFIYPPYPLLSPPISQQLRKLNMTSLENLDNLLFNTTAANNHLDRLFIVQEKYLIVFEIDLDETNLNLLREYYVNAPFIVIPLESIRDITSDYIEVHDPLAQFIYFPRYRSNNHFNLANWLHQRLMLLNDQYRQAWEIREEQRQLQEAQRIREEEYRRRLTFLIDEEAQHHLRRYTNDLSVLWNDNTSASADFIAQFRLSERSIVGEDLLGTTCSICLNSFQLSEYFSSWPCPGEHTFHFHCMLDVLRSGHLCPLCRHAVPAANLPLVVRLMFDRMVTNVFN